MSQDIRWKQRLANYEKALSQLSSAVELSAARNLPDLEKQGLIQAFEFNPGLTDHIDRVGISLQKEQRAPN